MKLFFLTIVAVATAVSANCGCLKVSRCNPNLKVITPEYSPCKVIYRTAPPSCGGCLPYNLEKAVVIPPIPPLPKELDYEVAVPLYRRPYCPCEHEYKLEKAVPPIPLPPLPLLGLKTATERVVVDAPPCPCQTCYGRVRPDLAGCTGSVWGYPLYGEAIDRQNAECACKGPTIEKLCPSLCGRYGIRRKRGIIGRGVKFLSKLINAPLVGIARARRRMAAVRARRLRHKRSVLVDELELPFLQIDDDDLDNYLERGRGHRRRDHDDPVLGNNPLSEHHPVVMLFRTPLKLLAHFQDLSKNFRPILDSFPKMIHSTKHYLKNFGKNFRTQVLDFASNVVGDFEHRPFGSLLFPSRTKRSAPRRKRYILKVVDEDEVQDFLREKLGGYFSKNASIEEEEDETVEKSKEKLPLKKLSSKVIVDNNGKAFVEINGHKKPLFYPKAKETVAKRRPEETEIKEKEQVKTRSKLDELIEKAKEKLNESDQRMPVESIKEKISEISTDIQDLIALNFNDYEDLYAALMKLDEEKKSLIDYWKSALINGKQANARCKIAILNHFRSLQHLKDDATNLIASHLTTRNNFILKKLIKTLVKLQKLQCLVHKVVEHFDQNLEAAVDAQKEIKFVDYLSQLCFVVGTTRTELKKRLEKEKDDVLKKEIHLLEKLRNVLKKEDAFEINEIAKCLWESKNIEKLQQGAIDEMNSKLTNNLKIRKELKILFDLVKQLEVNEAKCDKLLLKYDSKSKPLLTLTKRKRLFRL